MATTWADLIDEIRLELQDTGATPRYSNELLYVYTKDAVRDYSQWLPLLVLDETLTEDDAVALKYELPSGALDIVNVQCPKNRFLQPKQSRPGETSADIGSAMYYRVDATSIYLNDNPDASEVLLTYHSVHPIPTFAEIFPDVPVVPPATPPELTVPDGDIELIKLFVIGKVQIMVRNSQSRLDRFKITAGSREDNPMIIEADDYMKRYREGIALRMRGGVVQLYRPQKFVRSNR